MYASKRYIECLVKITDLIMPSLLEIKRRPSGRLFYFYRFSIRKTHLAGRLAPLPLAAGLPP